MTDFDVPGSPELSLPSLEKNNGIMPRDELLRVAGDLIQYIYDRVCAERFREYETDKARTAYARVLVAAIQAYGSILKDGELDELKKRIAALETAKGIINGNN